MPFFRFLLLLLPILFAPVLQAQRERLPPEEIEFVEKTWPGLKKTSTGIRYLILQEGTGATPKSGASISVLYVGKLLDGKVFDEARDPTRPFTFRLAREEVIQGWDQTLSLMKRGEKRLVIIPAELAYGSRGQPPRVPRNATLVFEIELLEFKSE